MRNFYTIKQELSDAKAQMAWVNRTSEVEVCFAMECESKAEAIGMLNEEIEYLAGELL